MRATELWLVRHGESTANVAAAEAEREGHDVIQTKFRDAEVPLSPLGEQQATALRGWLADQFDDGQCVLVAAHDAVILPFLDVCNELMEQQSLDFSLTHTVTNASVTKLLRPSNEGPWTEHPGIHDAAIH